ncbi:MAG: hypothetical protein PVI90_19910, partial [Desulfobacteraceae bacterium]
MRLSEEPALQDNPLIVFPTVTHSSNRPCYLLSNARQSPFPVDYPYELTLLLLFNHSDRNDGHGED